MNPITDTGPIQTGAAAHNDLSDSAMAAGAEGSAHGQSVDGMETGSGSDPIDTDPQGEIAPASGTVASVKKLPVPFEQPDNTPPVGTPAPVVELNQDGGKNKPPAKAKRDRKQPKTTGKNTGNGKAETKGAAKPVPPSLDDMLATVTATCAADRDAVSAVLADRKGCTDKLTTGFSTTDAAGAAILALTIALDTMSAERKRKFIESLQVKDKNGITKNMTYNARAQVSVAIPLTIYGYGHMSGGHVSKMGTIVRYGHVRGVKPDGFATFLAEHTGDKGGGFKNTYIAAKNFFIPGKADGEKQAAADREAVVEMLKKLPSIGIIEGKFDTDASYDGFDCLIAVRDDDGKSRVVSRVVDKDGLLFNILLATFIPVVNAKVPPVPASRAKDNLKTAAKAAIVISKSN